MTQDLPIDRERGGSHWPMSSRQFILDHLAEVGEDYVSNMHRAYKAALDQLARDRRRRYAYHKPRSLSFIKVVQKLVMEGLIEPSGREEPSDDPRFENWDTPPMRIFYRLVQPKAD